MTCSPEFAGDPGNQYLSVAAIGLAIAAVVATSPPFEYNGASGTQDTPLASMYVFAAPQVTYSGGQEVGATVDGLELDGTAEGSIVGLMEGINKGEALG